MNNTYNRGDKMNDKKILSEMVIADQIGESELGNLLSIIMRSNNNKFIKIVSDQLSEMHTEMIQLECKLNGRSVSFGVGMIKEVTFDDVLKEAEENVFRLEVEATDIMKSVVSL